MKVRTDTMGNEPDQFCGNCGKPRVAGQAACPECGATYSGTFTDQVVNPQTPTHYGTTREHVPDPTALAKGNTPPPAFPGAPGQQTPPPMEPGVTLPPPPMEPGVTLPPNYAQPTMQGTVSAPNNYPGMMPGQPMPGNTPLPQFSGQ